MPRATCLQSVPSLCSEGVARLASADQRLPECFGHFANPQWAPPVASPVMGTGKQGWLTLNLHFSTAVSRSSGCTRKQPRAWALQYLWGLEKGEALAARGGGRRPALRSWACQSRRSFRRPQPARLCGWPGGRPLRVRQQGLGPLARSRWLY